MLWVNVLAIEQIKKGKLLELDDSNRFWTKVSRLSRDSDVGIIKFIFLGGTNNFNELKGKSCTYAVNYFENKIFGNSKWIISDELFKKLRLLKTIWVINLKI